MFCFCQYSCVFVSICGLAPPPAKLGPKLLDSSAKQAPCFFCPTLPTLLFALLLLLQHRGLHTRLVRPQQHPGSAGGL